MQANQKPLILKGIGLIISILPPLLAVFSFFPIWKERGAEAMLSGISLFLILISAVPFFRAVKAALKSPSAPLIWFVLFVLFFSLSKIADDITVISFIGFVSNLAGALFFSLAKRFEVKKTNEK